MNTQGVFISFSVWFLVSTSAGRGNEQTEAFWEHFLTICPSNKNKNAQVCSSQTKHHPKDSSYLEEPTSRLPGISRHRCISSEIMLTC